MAAVALPRTAAPARRPSVAAASRLLLGQRPFLASSTSCFAAGRAAVARPAAGLRLLTRRQRHSVGAIADNYPIVEVAIEPKDEADADKMANGLTKLAQEIPSIQFTRNEMTVLKGTSGELHLDIIVDRLKREFNVEVNVGDPQIIYREIISKIVESQYAYTPDARTYADVTLRIEPMERGSGYEFKSEIKGGAMPEEDVSRVMKGIEDALPIGILARCPVVDLRVVLVDFSNRYGLFRPYKIAARLALLEGLRKAGPRLLEPVMRVEVITPEEHLDDTTDRLARSRGELKSLEDKPGGLQVIEALMPLEDMLDFGSLLNDLSKGRASYTMKLAKFINVPEHMQAEISKERLK